MEHWASKVAATIAVLASPAKVTAPASEVEPVFIADAVIVDAAGTDIDE